MCRCGMITGLTIIILLFLSNQFITITIADFPSESYYKTEFNNNYNDNCTVTMNGWTETFVNGWDGTQAAYFNESSKGTDNLRVHLQKTTSGADITNVKGVYFEFKVFHNYSNTNAGVINLRFNGLGYTFDFVFAPQPNIIYCYLNDNGDRTRTYELGLYKEYLNRTWHRMFFHFDNISGLCTAGLDDMIMQFYITPRVFVVTNSASIYLQKIGHPGIMIDNIMTLTNQTFSIEDYMAQFYPNLKIAYTPNNYDFTYTPLIHADGMTLNNTHPVHDFYEKYNMGVGQTYFYNRSVWDVETLEQYPSLRNYALANQDKHEIFVHSFDQNVNLNTSQVKTVLEAWKNLMGAYPLIDVDHAYLSHNIAQNGSNSSSPFYINSLRNSSCMKYVWAFLDEKARLPIPKGYVYTQRNSLTAFQYGNNGAVYSIKPIDNLFTSGNQILNMPSSYKWWYFLLDLINHKGLNIEHNYQHNYVYKNVNGTKYTKCKPLPSGYTSWNDSIRDLYDDVGHPYLIMPELIGQMNNITHNFTVYNGKVTYLLDRATIYNNTKITRVSNIVYVNTPFTLDNITVYSRTNMSGKALTRNDNYYLFTKGYTSFGATIPSNKGNTSYNLVDWNYSIADTGQIGRMVFQSDGNIDIHCKKSGKIAFQLTTVPNPNPINIYNITEGSKINFTTILDTISFIGKVGCEYLVKFNDSNNIDLNGTIPEKSTGTPGFEIIIIICALILTLFWIRKRNICD